MEVHKSFKVMVSGYGSLLVISSLVCMSTASICVQSRQYFNTKLESCVNCTLCGEGDIVVRPCELHRDTLCRPIKELLKSIQPSNPHRHKHVHRGRHSGNHEGTMNNHSEGDFEITSTEAPFSSAETLVWDWQAIALSSAVFACFLFFLAITLYSLHQAKQWRRLKDTFDADVEELSAKLSLMAASSSEKGEILEPRIGPITDGNYLNNRCVYLEQLLSVRKDTKIGSEKRGNVYIEETSASPATSGKT
ncbi:tumor necrosis factor receptor superfamily member wengen [Tribolium madens]|uniref:tumor necrosis factor receptor superfamily member wengen n=1 Tax=Tribolium madens TaxID=41895 RepID=UPI001CF737E8|nr:tumor necrosis factor receptor superfamily member wengen [Tribolium madens]